MSSSRSTSASAAATSGAAGAAATTTPPHQPTATTQTARPAVSFAAAILKGNSTPAPAAPMLRLAPRTAPAASTTAAAKKPMSGKPASAAAPPAPEKKIPLADGSAWAQKLSLSGAPKAAPAAAPTAAQTQPKSVPAKAATATTPSTASSSAATATAPTPSPSTAPSASASSTLAAAPSAVTATAAAITPAPSSPAPTSFAAALRTTLPPSATPAAATATADSTSTPAAATTPSASAPKKATRNAKKAANAAAKKQQPAAAPVATTATVAPAPAAAPVAPVAAKKSVTIEVPAATATTRAASPLPTPTARFGLVAIDSRNGRKNSTIAPTKENSPAPGAPISASTLPPGYTLYPLSPYQLFLLDPRTGAVTPSLSAVHAETGLIEELSGAATDAVPLVLIPQNVTGGAGVLHPLCGLLATQLEWYFRADNLARDTFLRRRMAPESGYVRLTELLTFPRIRSLTASAYYLEVAARYCVAEPTPVDDTDATVSEAKKASSDEQPPDQQPLFKVKNGAIRLRSNWRRWVFPVAGAPTRKPTPGGARQAEEEVESSDEEDAGVTDSPTADVDQSTLSTNQNTPSQTSRAESPLEPAVVAPITA